MVENKPAGKRGAEGAPPAKKQRTANGSKPVGRPGGKTTSKPAAPPAKLNRKERKELERTRKARRNKNFGLIEEVKALWEDARRHDVTPDKRSKLVSAILGKVQGRLAELAGSHTASRIIQTCAKYGSQEERAAMLRELEPKLLELSKSPHGHFVASKLVSLATKAQLPGLLKVFRGHLGELLRHPAGCQVVDELHAVADGKQRNLMAAEFYGKEYVLFEGGTLNNSQGAPAHLSDLMARVDGAKQRSIIQHMSKDLLPIMEKGLVDCPLLHRLISEFMEFSPASVVADAAESLSGDPILHMVHTKDGVKAACMALAYGTAKDRKKAIKAMKGHVGTMSRDEWGHLALITALSVVDDTTLLRKVIVAELQDNLAELAEHRYGYRVLVQLLSPCSPRYLPPQLMAIVRPPPKELSAEAAARQAQGAGEGQAAAQDQGQGEVDGEEEGIAADSDDEEGGPSRPAAGPLGLSKKQPDVRRRELLGSGGGGLAAALAALCASAAAQLARSQHGSDILVEVCRGGDGGVLAECLGGEASLAAVHEALAAAVAAHSSGGGGGSSKSSAAAAADAKEEGDEEQQEPILTNFFGSRALRRLLLAAAASDASGRAAATFATRLWQAALHGRCKQWVDTHAAKVLAAMLQCGDAGLQKAAAKELKPLVQGSLEEWAARLTGGGGVKKPQAAVIGKRSRKAA